MTTSPYVSPVNAVLTQGAVYLRRINIFWFSRDFIRASGQEQTEANECEHKVES